LSTRTSFHLLVGIMRDVDPRPDFFIVGAFKAGTSALYEYLRAHPQVFMPFHKEPLYFGDDLTRRYGRMSEAEYLDLFRDAAAGQRVGEASTWYLYSACAAQEIKSFAPQAQIVVMLRNPVDVMYAQHSQLLFNAGEDIPDFADALAAEPARKRGERLPPGPVRVENMLYREGVRFAEQLERYHDAFGSDRVHVVVYDDFRDDTAGAYAGVLEFLGVDASFRPDFAVVNANKRPRLEILQRAIYRPPRRLLGAVGWLRRFPMVHAARAALVRANSRSARRPPMDPGLRAELTREFEPEVRRLERLIGRELTAWTMSGRS
jgi:hypothetical protein